MKSRVVNKALAVGPSTFEEGVKEWQKKLSDEMDSVALHKARANAFVQDVDDALLRAAPYSSTYNTPAPRMPTLDHLLKVKKLLDESEPVRAFMLKHGFDPERGDLFFVPESMRSSFGPYPPAYVVSSPYVQRPVLVRGRLVSIGPVTLSLNVEDVSCVVIS